MRIKHLIIATFLIGLVLVPFAVKAQVPPKPPPDTPKPTVDPIVDGYTIDMTTELGVRFLGTDGSVNKYRSDLNYGKGFRLFDYNLLMRHVGGSASLFDTMRVSSHGLGGDPSTYTRVEIEKTKWYRFDMNFRRYEYFNNLTTIAAGLHTADLTRRFGDYNLTLLPQNDKIKINIGYTSDYQHGPSFSTTKYSNLIAGTSLAGDEFQVSTPVTDHSNDLHIGADGKLLGFSLSFMQGFRFYSQDTANIISTFTPGNNDAASINTFSRQMPVRGHLPYTRFSVNRLFNEKLDFTGRFVYSAANSNYTVIENTTGKDKSGNNIILDSFTGNGATRRLNTMADVGVSYYATNRLIISETFRFNTFHISGGDQLSELVTRTTAANNPLPNIFSVGSDLNLTSYTQYLNQIEADYKFAKRFSAHGGYRYTNRDIVLNDFHSAGLPPASPTNTTDLDTFSNSTNAAFVGFRAVPVSRWTIYGDVEKGTADNVFIRVSNYDYTNFRVRNIIKPTKTLIINASFVTKNNANPTVNPLSVPLLALGVETKSRALSTSVDWDPSPILSLSTGYTYNTAHTNAAILLAVVGKTGLQNGTSQYFVHDNFFFANVRVQVKSRAVISVGYRIDNDSGQGNIVPVVVTDLISSYPMKYQSPEAKVSIRLSRNVDWNAGWQYYDYKEKFATNQNYRATLAFSSLTIRFNRE